MVVISASLQNHDGPGGNTVNRGIWAKIYNIQSKTWLTTEPFNVNQDSTGSQTESATVALTGLKFLIAFYTYPGDIKIRAWGPNSSSDVTTNIWTGLNDVNVNTVNVAHQSNLKWLRMPKESKVLLTWDNYDSSKINEIHGQFYSMITGVEIGSNFILLTR